MFERCLNWLSWYAEKRCTRNNSEIAVMSLLLVSIQILAKIKETPRGGWLICCVSVYILINTIYNSLFLCYSVFLSLKCLLSGWWANYSIYLNHFLKFFLIFSLLLRHLGRTHLQLSEFELRIRLCAPMSATRSSIVQLLLVIILIHFVGCLHLFLLLLRN